MRSIFFEDIEVSSELTKTLKNIGLNIFTKPPTEKNPADIVVLDYDEKTVKSWMTTFPKTWLVQRLPEDVKPKKSQNPRLLEFIPEKNWEFFLIQSLEKFILYQVDLMQSDDARGMEDLISMAHHLNLSLENHLETVAELQKKLLPNKNPQVQGVTILTKYFPAPGTGGDYFDVFDLGHNKKVGFLLADAENHASAAALLSCLLEYPEPEKSPEFLDPHLFIKALHAKLPGHVGKTKLSISVLFGVLDRSSLTWSWCSAGHLSPWVLNTQNPTTPFEIQCPSLGDPGFEEKDLETKTYNLKPGESLLLFTDGVTQALSGEKGIFEKLKNASLSLKPSFLRNEFFYRLEKKRRTTGLKDDATFIITSIEEGILYRAPLRSVPLDK